MPANFDTAGEVLTGFTMFGIAGYDVDQKTGHLEAHGVEELQTLAEYATVYGPATLLGAVGVGLLVKAAYPYVNNR